MFQQITESKTWKDPVWSKVIANGIWVLGAALGGVILGWLLGLSADSFCLFIKVNWQDLLNIILLVIILALLSKNRNLDKRLQPPIIKTGLDYLLSLPEEELDILKMVLVWFPINDTMRVKNRRGDAVEYKPIFAKMLEHKILEKQFALHASYYVIDKNVYEYIEKYSNSLSDDYMKDYRSATADDDFIDCILT